MTGSPTRDQIITAAQQLFTNRGYAATTIRDIASAAGVSPALVMKLTGSKAELFRAAAPEAVDLDQPPGQRDEPIGYRMVRAIVERRDVDDYEYWASLPFLLQEAPDRDAARAEMQGTTLTRIARRIGDADGHSVRTELVATLLIGLATSLRTAQLLTPGTIASEQLIDTYGTLVQTVIDRDQTSDTTH